MKEYPFFGSIFCFLTVTFVILFTTTIIPTAVKAQCFWESSTIQSASALSKDNTGSSSSSSSSSSSTTNVGNQQQSTLSPSSSSSSSSVSSSVSSSSSSKSVICRLKALDGLIGLDLITQGATAQDAEKLTIQCSDRFLQESELQKNVFHNLGNSLRVLKIDSCKLHKIQRDALNGLSAVKQFTVNTRNVEWGLGKSLELQKDSFDELKSLEVLNLADNNLRGIAEGSYCELSSLQVLNLTNNRIRSTESLGFTMKPCPGEGDLRILDLSNNELMTIPENWAVSKLRRLQHLSLQVNNITDISSEALSGLVSLRIFNISHNNLETIPADLFAGARDIQEIHLQYNRLFEIPRGLFHRLEQLLILDLSGNQISSHHIDNATFSGLIRLIVLNLAHNAVTRIDSKTFKDLYFLQILDLRNNSIGYIDDNTFLPLYNLHTLNLAENRLHTINDELFNGLFVLSKLTLNNNLISSIEPSAFKNCSDLKELDLSTNQLTDVPLAIQNLSMLRTLDLGENQITEILPNAFLNLAQLTGLRLIENQIGNITKGMFSDVPRLSVLNLAKNRVQAIELGAFDKNPEVEALRLDRNFLTDINGVFATMSSLLWLNLGENHMVWFDYAFIPSNLKWLDLHSNFITELGNYYKLQEEISLKTLDASHNRLSEIGPMSVPNSIELIFINNNFIETVHSNTFVDKVNLTRVDLYSNRLNKIHMHTLRLAPMPPTRPLPEFYLSGNPFECDCSMDWLQQINTLSTRQHPRIMDLPNIDCIMPHARGPSIRSLATLGTQDFLCPYDTHCFALCHCCDFDACDCEMTCPHNCTCYHDQTWSTNVVDCGGNNATDLPRKVPMDTTVLYLDGNVIHELKYNAFIGRKNLRALFLNSSTVTKIQKRAFVGLHGLEIIHLENNQLRSLQGHEFDNLVGVKELYLQNNLLESIANDTFAAMHQSLQVLRIDGNKLSIISMWKRSSTLRPPPPHSMPSASAAVAGGGGGNNIQSSDSGGSSYNQGGGAPTGIALQFENLKSLTIGRNSWTCRCTFLRELTAFVADNALIIEDSQDIYCVDGIVKHELDFNSTSDCSGFYEGRSVLPDIGLNEHVPLLLATILIVLVFVLLVIAIVFREPLRVWIFARCGVRMGETPCEDYEKLYDAVILYSEKDYELVSREIAAELEIRPPPLRLCLQHRDLSQDATYMQILESARVSKRIVILLSRNFLQTEWSRYEVRNAVHEALKDRLHKLVILEELDALVEAENDLEMLPYIKSRVVNTIKLSDKHFWEKLRYALPAELQQTCNNYTLHQHERLPKTTNSSDMCMQQQQSQHHHNNTLSSSQNHQNHHHNTHNHHHHHQAQAPPSYYQENDDANYSSATTATPSPRQSRRGASGVSSLGGNNIVGNSGMGASSSGSSSGGGVGGGGGNGVGGGSSIGAGVGTSGVGVEQQLHHTHKNAQHTTLNRPPSEHIYFSIESDYNGAAAMAAAAAAAASSSASSQPSGVTSNSLIGTTATANAGDVIVTPNVHRPSHQHHQQWRIHSSHPSTISTASTTSNSNKNNSAQPYMV